MTVASRFSAELSAQGGRVASLRLDGVELLVTEGPGPLAWGAYPMVPWAGRLAGGHLEFRGHRYQMPIDIETHAIHGTGYTSTWRFTDSQTSSPTSMTLDLVEPWPFGGRVTHRLALAADRVRFELDVVADRAMPAQVGWHPWFRREVGRGDPLEVHVAPGAMVEIDRAAIPTGRLVEVTPPPWDNCFVGLAMPPRLTWPGFATIELRSSCDHWVIYDHPEHAVCVEPQSGPPNALNAEPELVEPGRPLLAWFDIVVVD